MPRNVRNFWVELDVDGKASSIGTGPKNKEGGFYERILMRDKGQVKIACKIIGEADEQGRLRLRICPNQDLLVTIVGEQSFVVSER